MMKTLKELALLECKIGDIMRLDQKNRDKCSKTLIKLLISDQYSLGIELEKNKNHTCSIKGYSYTHSNIELRRSISKASQCWCACDNVGTNKPCMCNCNMLFGAIIEIAEKEADARIKACMMDHLKIEEVMMLPDFMIGNASNQTTVKEALEEKLSISEFRFLDRIIYY